MANLDPARKLTPVVAYDAAGVPNNRLVLPVVLYDQSGNPAMGIQSGTFANLPAAPTAGTFYYATDIGSGVLLVYTGAKWKPNCGEAIIAGLGAPVTLTGTTTATALANIRIPAGLLSVNGKLEVYYSTTYTATGAGSLQPKFSSATGTGGTAIGAAALSTGSFISQAMFRVSNLNSLSSQVATYNNNAGGGGFNVATGNQNLPSINTANDSFVNFVGTPFASGDTMTLQEYVVKWIEP